MSLRLQTVPVIAETTSPLTLPSLAKSWYPSARGLSLLGSVWFSRLTLYQEERPFSILFSTSFLGFAHKHFTHTRKGAFLLCVFVSPKMTVSFSCSRLTWPATCSEHVRSVRR